MRSFKDRVRHAVLFEAVLLCFAIGFGQLFFQADFIELGVLALLLTLIAMCVNGVFNLGFDYWLLRRNGHTQKTQALRILHSTGFELVLLLVTVPVMAWGLNISLIQALVADLGFILFVLFYGYLFNLWYDWQFPVESQTSHEC
ncbi:PACE efflux transporter [Shewanella gelidii]|uniref:Membrane protein n=1 Tax=Shewanella gelidii TaxID=1642821 RepID=A0A917JUE3_9GAMM|nr:PACE efflux transporter [Shewanella gelidii]MCL1098817.1 PACE efflux transporter [Shewanella gelidii]GGI87464.1 membrane protein [Shewanella gelidii]